MRLNVARVLTRMGGPKAIEALIEAVGSENIALASAAYSALESLGAAEGVEPPRKAEAPSIIKIETDDSEMVLIPEGNFIYGAREHDREAYSWEKLQQKIFLPAFYIDIYPVTNRQYSGFLNEVKPGQNELYQWIELSGESSYEKCRIKKKRDDYIVEKDYEDYPVIYVSWYGAGAYANWCADWYDKNYY